MNKHKSNFLPMQLEEARLESGRYNVDYTEVSPNSAAPSLLNAYRKAQVSFGLPFGKHQPKSQSARNN